ncbi:hypothetical protein [Prosthecobacter sp.]|nr:hypothetical protein [Prosthecobacter sp.]
MKSQFIAQISAACLLLGLASSKTNATQNIKKSDTPGKAGGL